MDQSSESTHIPLAMQHTPMMTLPIARLNAPMTRLMIASAVMVTSMVTVGLQWNKRMDGYLTVTFELGNEMVLWFNGLGVFNILRGLEVEVLVCSLLPPRGRMAHKY